MTTPALDGVAIGGTTAAPKVNSLTFGNKPSGVTRISGAITPWLNEVVSYTGTTSGTSQFNYLGINDQLVGDTNYTFGLRVAHNVNSPAVGLRCALFGEIDINSAGTNTQATANYVGVTGRGTIKTGFGGTGWGAGQPIGGVWGGWFYSQLLTGTYVSGVVGVEIDTLAASGTTVFAKNGLRIVDAAASVVRGSVEDAAVVISNSPTATAGWVKGIMFGSEQGSVNTPSTTYLNWPFAADSTMIGTSSVAAGHSLPANIGIDFSRVTFRGPAIKTGAASIAMAEMASAPTAAVGEGQLYVASDGSLHYRGPNTDTQVAPA